jgi:hypothetical protein
VTSDLRPASVVKPVIYSIVNVLVGAFVYWHLIKGGWLTNQYHLNDPNIVNLVLAIFEPIAIAGVIAYWIAPKAYLARLLFILFLAQVIIAVGFLAFILLFFLSWHAKMM